MFTTISKRDRSDQSRAWETDEQMVKQRQPVSGSAGQPIKMQESRPISEGCRDKSKKSTVQTHVWRWKKDRVTIATMCFLGIAFILGSFHSAEAACNTYYVSTSGNDGNPGTISSPWRTLNKASGKVAACDMVYVRGGIYAEAINIRASGTASAPIRISGYPGELPTIDGQGRYPTSNWASLVNLIGNYIVMSGFEVRNTSNYNAMGVVLYGHHNRVSSVNVHHTHQNGILIKGDYGVVENCSVWQASKVNVNGGSTQGWSSGLSAARDAVNGLTDNAVMRGNTVFDNWGEGFSTFEANGTIMENNVVYDNWSANTYISDARNVIFKDNLVYTTPNNSVNKKSMLLQMSDEVSSKPRSANNAVINNMFFRGDIAAFTWTGVPGSGLVNALIANNTIVNGTIFTGSIMQGSSILNNIVFRNDNGVLARVATRSGLSLSNNLWSSTPPTNASGAGDIIGDPKLTRTGSTAAGQLTKNYFGLSLNSPAVNKGGLVLKVIGNYLITSQGKTLNIGAYTANLPIEFVATP